MMDVAQFLQVKSDVNIESDEILLDHNSEKQLSSTNGNYESQLTDVYDCCHYGLSSLPLANEDIPILLNEATLECVLESSTLMNEDYSLSSESSSLGHGSCLESYSDYEMVSVSSWELNLMANGDDDALESEEDNDKVREEKDLASEISTVENSPNIFCCSVKTPVTSNESSNFFQKVCLKRRNAVRQNCKCPIRKTSWALLRPQNGPSLHNAIILDSEVIGGDECEKGVTINYFVSSSKYNISSILNEFCPNSVYVTIPEFTSYNNPINFAKNRYADIPCIEQSRVKLLRDISGSISSKSIISPQTIIPTDYIHANWVDGYRQQNAFICTQGPMNTTVSDFWHMVIQYRAPIIVMTTRPKEKNTEKCYQYWPENIGETKVILPINDQYDTFEITSLKSKEFGPNCPTKGVCNHFEEHWYRVTLLQVRNYRTGQEHKVNHFYYHSWPDQGIPRSSQGFLHFILQIRQTYRLNIGKLDYESEMDQPIPPPPIIAHCSAGIGRTGTYIVTEICSKSLYDCGRFNLYQTLLKVRSQRYKSVQNSFQYVFCRNTIIEYAKSVGLLEVNDEMDKEECKEEEECEEYIEKSD